MSTRPSGTYQPSGAPSSSGILDLSVVIVNYNVREFLEQALRSLERARGSLAMEVFVVDNNSVDGSVEMVREAFPEVQLIVNRDNVGFGKANNQALRRARGRYLFVLNPDTIVQEDTLQTLVQFMDAHPEAGAVGCKILNPDGTFAPESRRTFPTPAVAFYRITGLSRLFPKSPTFGRYNLTYLPVDEVAEVDALSGSCMLVRREAVLGVRVPAYDGRSDSPEGVRSPRSHPHTLTPSHPPPAGLFDEDFFMYGEDLDWCYRIQQAGWTIYYTPETQIIHYKGESTKKGELRYVRLFYGAMLLFAEKHLEGRYSGVMTLALRAGIMLRAGLGVVSRGVRRVAQPLVDGLLVYLVVAAIGVARSLLAGTAPGGLFFATTPLGFAVGTVAGVAAVGGYRHRQRRRLRPVLVGTLAGLLVVATASFFVKDIAFSRLVVGAGFLAATAALVGRRLLSRPPVRTGPRRAVLVGPACEAERLRALLAGQPLPPFELVGYVTAAERSAGNGAACRALPRFGRLEQLRDVVRVRRIDEVVFAADGVPNHVIIDHIQQLHDLPVQVKILAEGRAHVIGKASVDDLSLPALVEAETAVGTPRSRGARRSFEVVVAALGVLAHPLLAGMARLGHPGARAVAARTRRLPAVLRGACALVGYDPAVDPVPETPAVPPAVFSIADTLPPHPAPSDVQRAYGFYITNASASLDWDIILRSLQRLWNAAAPRP